MSRNYQLVTDVADLPAIADAVKASGRFALDTETTGVDPFAPGFALVGVVLAADENTGYYLPVGHEGFQGTSQPENLPVEEVKELLRDLYRQSVYNGGEVTPVYHNSAYDRIVLARTLGIELDETYGEDTILLSHLADENSPKTLKHRAKTYLGVQEAEPDQKAVDDEFLERVLLEEETYLHRYKNGNTKEMTRYELRDDWVERLTRYYSTFSEGAVPYKFVEHLMRRAYTAMKRKKIVVNGEPVEFKGSWQGDFRYVPPAIAVKYANDDVMNTLGLYSYFETIFLPLNPRLEELYREIELPVNDIMTRATLRGVRADRLHLEQMRDTLERRAAEIRDTAMRRLELLIDGHEDDFDLETILTSSKQLQHLFFEVLGYPVVERTKTGNPSAGKSALKKLKEETPSNAPHLAVTAKEFIDAKLQYQDVTKLINTYTDSLISKIDEEGRIHPNYKVFGTVSGRMSSNSPNFQQMPRLTPEEVASKPWLYGIDVRAAFTADEDYVFVSADYTSMEMVVAAAVSQDPDLKHLLAEGKDLHIHTAKNSIFVVYEHLTDEQFKETIGFTREELRDLSDDDFKAQPNLKVWRQDAKVVNFSQLYAGTYYTLHKSFGFPIEKAKMLEEGFAKAYPRLKQWMHEVYDVLDRDHQIEYPEFGYVKRMDLPPSWMKKKDRRGYERQFEAAKRTCLNAVIQGYSAFIVKKALVGIQRQLEEEGLDAQVIYQVHDELGVMARREDAPRAQEIMLEHMRRYVADVWLDADPEFKLTMSTGEQPLDLNTMGSGPFPATFKSIEEMAEDDASLTFAEDDDDLISTFSRDDMDYVAMGVRTFT